MNKNALDLIKNNYTEFSKYTMKFRTYASVYDGMKIAQRRILYAMFSKAPASKKIKASSALGLTMQLHPHSEALDTLLNLGGEYRSSFPLFETQGNWGSNFGPASAPRYLECRLNDVARKIYFSLIDEAPFDNFEVEDEPIYLPTLFPLAFLQGCFSIGQGTPNPLIPDLVFDDLKKFIINYIKTGEKKVTKQNFVRFVDYDKIRDDKNRDNDICNVLNTGKGSVYFQPTVTLKDNTITVTNLYVLADFKSLMDKLQPDIQADKIDVRDESTTERVWIIEKVKNKSFDMEACAKMIKQKFTYKENYAMYFHDEEGRVKPYSLGEIVELCYGKYCEAYVTKINKEIHNLYEQQQILECLALMSEHTDIVINNQISNDTKIKRIKEAIDNAYNEHIIEKSLAKPIHMLKNDKKSINKIQQEIDEKQQKLDNIGSVITEDLGKL